MTLLAEMLEADRSTVFHRSPPPESSIAVRSGQIPVQGLIQWCSPMALEAGDLAGVDIRSQHMVHFLARLHEVKRTQFLLFLSAVNKNTETS